MLKKKEKREEEIKASSKDLRLAMQDPEPATEAATTDKYTEIAILKRNFIIWAEEEAEKDESGPIPSLLEA